MCGNPLADTEKVFCAKCDDAAHKKPEPPILSTEELLIEQKNDSLELAKLQQAEMEARALALQKQIDAANSFRLDGFHKIFTPDLELTTKTNVYEAEIHTRKVIHEWTFEELEMGIERAISYIETCRHFLSLRKRTLSVKKKDIALINSAADTRKQFKEDGAAKVAKKRETEEQKIINSFIKSTRALHPNWSETKIQETAKRKYEMGKAAGE
jgi:hypothetical protein